MNNETISHVALTLAMEWAVKCGINGAGPDDVVSFARTFRAFLQEEKGEVTFDLVAQRRRHAAFNQAVNNV